MNYFHGRESGFWQQPVTGCLWLALVFMWGGALRGGGGVNCYFSGRFCYYWRNVQFGGETGRWANIPWGLDTFLIFPNFLRS